MNVINIFSLAAYKMLNEDSNACVIDVRTSSERNSQGVPVLNNPIYHISRRILPDMQLNPLFYEEFTDQTKDLDPSTFLFFLCKSGQRSYEAANRIAATGMINCYNILDGFEGGNGGIGWKANNLPWQI